MNDRRRDKRHRSWFVVELVGDGGARRLAMARNMSRRGVLLATAAQAEVGASLTLTFKVTPEAPTTVTVAGRVVRRELNREDASGMWPHHLGVELEQPLADVDELLPSDGASWTNDYLVDLERGAE